ncbi:MAG: cation transporter [Oscillospiraceae bacterium]|nr:cation transporter [Oscillospiraceae bacterium]
MIRLLAGIFIKNKDNVGDPSVRRAYGVLSSVLGIILNILLFCGKYAVGVLIGSVAVKADAINNITDAGSSIMTLLGFKFAGSRPDADHPFGHGRYEYIAGFVVSMVILLMAVETAKSSVQKIIDPSPVEVSAVAIVIMAASILVKLYIFAYNRRLGIKLDSPALKAVAADSISDCAATLVVLITTVVSDVTGLALDGWGGLAVALFILYSGINSARDTLSPLLGKAPDKELVQEIERIILAHEEVVGIHDLMVHDYGPGRLIISVHGEVSGAGDIFKLHDAIDCIEEELNEKLGCESIIHMDPIDTDDKRIAEMREAVSAIARAVSPELTIHDFRMVPGDSHTNLIFDLVLPHRFELSGEETSRRICEAVSACWPDHKCVIKTEQSYI